MGLNGVDLLKAEAAPVSLVNHAARETTDRSRYWVLTVARAWLKHDRAWAAPLFEAVLQCLSLPVQASSDTAANRRLCLVRLAAAGARIPAATLDHLRSLLEPLGRSKIYADGVARIALAELTGIFERHAGSDCTSNSGACATDLVR